MNRTQELLNQDYTADSNPEEAVELISIAYKEFKAVVEGKVRVYPTNKPVLPNLAYWGEELEDYCYVCLAGSAFYKAYGMFCCKGPDEPLPSGMHFLNGLRYSPEDRSSSWNLVKKLGFVVPEYRPVEFYSVGLLAMVEEFLLQNGIISRTVQVT